MTLCSAEAMILLVLFKVSGFREMQSMPCSTRNSVNSG